jgi:hypothetical protein
VDGLLYLISQETGQTVYSFDSKLIKQINRGQVND